MLARVVEEALRSACTYSVASVGSKVSDVAHPGIYILHEISFDVECIRMPAGLSCKVTLICTCTAPTLAQYLRDTYTIDPNVFPRFTKCAFEGQPLPSITWMLNSTLYESSVYG